MSGNGISLDYDLSLELPIERLQTLSEADENELLEQIGEQVLQATLLRFDNEETPDGDKWEPSYRAQAEGGRTLQDRGHLRDSYTYQVGGGRAEIGSDMIYAAIHHEGGVIKAKGGGKLKFKVGDRWAQKDQVEIPARPALGISNDDEADIDDISRDFYEGLINGH